MLSAVSEESIPVGSDARRISFPPRLVAILLVVLGIAVLCRIPAINTDPIDFQPTRQLRGAMVARGIEARLSPPADAQLASAAKKTADDQGLLEPPIFDAVNGASWAVFGEHLWLARLFAALGYVAGGLALWLVMAKLIDRAAAWGALLFYLFAEYGLVAATSIQPDPWLIGAMCAVLLTSVNWALDPSSRTRRTLMVAAAGSVFLKPIIAPIVVGTIVGAWLTRSRSASVETKWHLWRVLVVGVLPGALFLGIGTATGAIPTGQATTSFIASLLSTATFWRGWWTQIGLVVTVPIFLASIFGLVAATPKLLRAVGLGWLAGYVAFGISVDYRISTHDYYSLPLLPIVAVGIGAGVSWLLRQVPRYQPFIVAALGVVLFIGVASFWRGERNVCPQCGSILTEYASVGQSLRGTTAIVLSGDSGGAFGFYARVRYIPWPATPDLQLDALAHHDVPTASDRLRSIVERSAPRVFVVTALKEIDAQPDLKAVLATLPVVYRSDHVAVYQLPES